MLEPTLDSSPQCTYMIFIYFQRSRVQIPYGPEFFSGLISTTSSVVFIAARIAYICLFTAVHIYDFHIFPVIIISDC